MNKVAEKYKVEFRIRIGIAVFISLFVVFLIRPLLSWPLDITIYIVSMSLGVQLVFILRAKKYELDSLKNSKEQEDEYNLHTLSNEYDKYKLIRYNKTGKNSSRYFTYTEFKKHITENYSKFSQDEDFIFSVENWIRLRKWGKLVVPAIQIPLMIALVSGFFPKVGEALYIDNVELLNCEEYIAQVIGPRVQLISFIVVMIFLCINSMNSVKSDDDYIHFCEKVLMIIKNPIDDFSTKSSKIENRNFILKHNKETIICESTNQVSDEKMVVSIKKKKNKEIIKIETRGSYDKNIKN